jgi:hypothetical protein
MSQSRLNEVFIKIKASEFFYFIRQIIESAKSENMPVCKIVDWHETDNAVKLLIQISGTSGVTHYSPSEILSDHKFLRQFDQLDVVAIKNFETYETLKPKYKISSIDFSKTDKIKIKQVDGMEKEYCIKDFRKDFSLLSNLSQLDSFLIGRMVGKTEFDID